MKKDKRIKVLLAKTSLDGHNRGIKVISKWLMDSGMEVVYLGMYQKETAVVKAAIDEDVDVIGLSFLGGEHLFSVKVIQEEIIKQNVGDIMFIVGGIIPRDDIDKLYDLGVDKVFIPGTPLKEISDCIKQHKN